MVLRICTVCGQEDGHPRDVRDLGGGQSSIAHLQCCAEQGCDSCAEQLRGAEDLRGDDLRAHLESQTPASILQEN